jgi:hypothetical protein
MLYVMFGWDNYAIPKLKVILKNKPRPKKIIIFYAQEYQLDGTMFNIDKGLDKVLEIVKKYKIAVVLISGGSESNRHLIDFSTPLYRNLEIVYWRNFWLFSTYFKHIEAYNENLNQSGLDIRNEDTLKNNNHCEYKYIFLNNRTPDHRCMLIDQMAKYNLLSKGAVSWHESKYDKELFESPFTSIERGFVYKYWSPEILILDQEYVLTQQQDILPKQYACSWVQLVAETTVDNFFLTEKTAVPLFYMKLFIVGSCKNFHSELQSMGFHLYDEIFDYKFDSIDDIETRCNLIALNIKKITELSENDIKKLNTKLLPKLKANRDRAIELAIKLRNQPLILKEINSVNDNFNLMLNFKDHYSKLI